MDKPKNSILLKLGALAVVAVVAWISLTSACTTCSTSPGQVCFSLDQSTCTFPPGTQLCMTPMLCGSNATGPDEGPYLYPGTLSCTDAVSGSTPSIVQGKVSFNGGPTFTATFTWAELGATSSTQAVTNFDNQFPHPPFTVSDVVATMGHTYTASPLCFTKLISCGSGFEALEAERFTGYIKCPGGAEFNINNVSLDDEIAGDECANSNVTVSVVPPCPTCP